MSHSASSGPGIEAVVEEHGDRLMRFPGVVGVAVGEREGVPCIRVLVRETTRELTERIPDRLSGYGVEIVESGPLNALG